MSEVELLTSGQVKELLGITDTELRWIRDYHSDKLPFTNTGRGTYYKYKLSDVEKYQESQKAALANSFARPGSVKSSYSAAEVASWHVHSLAHVRKILKQCRIPAPAL